MRKSFPLLLSLLLLSTFPAFSQSLQPAPPLELVSAGYGAAALGLGGAFVAVADDLSAIYWNPAGLAQLPGLQLYVDYRRLGDSDEDIGEENTAGRIDSRQRFSLSGNQFQSFSVSYAYRRSGFTLVPAFAYQRPSVFAFDRELKDVAESNFSSGSFSSHSEALFTQEFTKADTEYAFGVGASISGKLLIGGTWSLLRNGPEQTLTGTFSDTTSIPGTIRRVDTNLTQEVTNDFSGNYLRLGVLAFPAPALSLGGTVRLPYTRRNIAVTRMQGPFTQTETTLDSNGNIIDVQTTTGNVDQTSSTETELKIPLEWSVGAAIRPRVNFLASGSVTYSNWTDTSISLTSVPGSDLPFPTLHGAPGNQPSLLQWRGGVQYLIGEVGNGLVVRSGLFRDGQPFGTTGKRTYFNGYSFGLGYASRGVRFDVAMVRESGDVLLTPQSTEASHFQNRRWILSVGFIGQ
jgi:long-chain fatty acid transport protein